MTTLASISDLYRHMEWADALVWSKVPAVEASDPDETLRTLLAHIHATQLAFEAAWHGNEVDYRQEVDFPTLSAVRAYGRPFYRRLPDFLSSLSDTELQKPLPVPWVRYYERRIGGKAVVTTLGETMVQVALHTQYHRAQVNTRLRQLEVVPPLVDYIAWLWRGRPEPEW